MARNLNSFAVFSFVSACSLLGLSALASDDFDYEYDALGRLKKVTYNSSGTVDYSYDAAGNRTQVSATSSSNNAPVWGTIPSQSWAQNSSGYSLDLKNFLNEEGDETYGETNLPAGLMLDTSTGVISGTPTASPGIYSVQVSANDGVNAQANQTFSFEVTTGSSNNAPVWSAIPSQSWAQNSSGYSLDLKNFLNEEGDETYGETNLPAGLMLDTSTGVISGTPTASPGIYSVQVSANDGVNAQANQTFSFEVTTGSSSTNLFDESNDYPSFETSSAPWYADGGSAVPSTDDAYTGSKSFKIESINWARTNSGNKVSLSSGNTYCMQAYGKSSSLSGGGISIGFQQYSNDGFHMSDDSSGVTTPSGHVAQITSSDTSWTKVGMCFTAPATYDYRLRIEQSGSGTAYLDDIFVCEGSSCLGGSSNNAPVWGTIPSQSWAQNSSGYSLDLKNFLNEEGDETYGETNLPAGLMLDTSTGVISGTPTASPGIYSVQVSANDGVNAQANQTFSFEVTTGSSNNAPVWSAIPSQSWAQNSSGYSLDLKNFLNEEGDETYGETNLPAGLMLDTSTGVISGTPTASPGIYSVQVSANDGVNAQANQTFSFEVTTGSSSTNLFDESNDYPSFETSSAPWYADGGSAVPSTDDAYTGSKSFKIESINWARTNSGNKVSLSSGNTYCMQAYGKSSSLSGGGISIGFQQYSNDGFHMSDDSSGVTTPSGHVAQITSSDTSWTKVGMCFTAPATYDYRLRIEQSGSGTAYLDDIFVCEGSSCLP